MKCLFSKFDNLASSKRSLVASSFLIRTKSKLFNFGILVNKLKSFIAILGVKLPKKLQPQILKCSIFEYSKPEKSVILLTSSTEKKVNFSNFLASNTFVAFWFQ